MTTISVVMLCAALGADALGPGDHVRKITVDDLERTYYVHVPPQYDPKTLTPLVIALHGAGMNGRMMEWFSGLSETADQAGFIIIYPSGTGREPLLTWNAGWFNGKINRVDDVKFLREMLDEAGDLLHVDPQRIYACGMSNGGMMCYRLAAELSDRIAAIAPVAGTIALEECHPSRPVPVLHFHGTQDELVPFRSDPANLVGLMGVKGAEESVETWVKLNGCEVSPVVDTLSDSEDDLKVVRTTYRGGKNDAEVVLITIEGGGHTWPGERPPVTLLGKSAMGISANEMMWEFFQKHPRK
ncbi:MAG: PHB depolymerase family esterase [Planctomycetaceae bacterium]